MEIAHLTLGMGGGIWRRASGGRQAYLYEDKATRNATIKADALLLQVCCPRLYIGLRPVKCMGLVESIAEFCPAARWQRCGVHFY